MKRNIQAATTIFLCATIAFASRDSDPATAPTSAPSATVPASPVVQAEGLCAGICTGLESVCVSKPPQVVESPDYEITLICAPFHCPPCESAKAHRVPWLESHGWTVNVCEADDDDNVESFPTWIVTRHGIEVHRWSGHSWTAGGTDTFNRNLRIAKGENVTSEVSGTSSLADWIDSHYRAGQNLDWGVYGVTAYDHLQDGSGGTHTWTRQQLAGLTEWQLLCLHDATHKGLIRARDW